MTNAELEERGWTQSAFNLRWTHPDVTGEWTREGVEKWESFAAARVKEAIERCEQIVTKQATLSGCCQEVVDEIAAVIRAIAPTKEDEA